MSTRVDASNGTHRINLTDNYFTIVPPNMGGDDKIIEKPGSEIAELLKVAPGVIPIYFSREEAKENEVFGERRTFEPGAEQTPKESSFLAELLPTSLITELCPEMGENIIKQIKNGKK